MFLNSMPISPIRFPSMPVQSFIQGFGSVQQYRILSVISHRKCIGRITIISLVNTTIDRNNISFLQNIRRRNSVYDLLIYRSAKCFRISPVTQKSRFCPVIPNKFFSDFIEFQCETPGAIFLATSAKAFKPINYFP